MRTQFLKRMVGLADTIGMPIQLLYYPPYHSKYNPIVGFAFPKGTVLGHSRTTLEWDITPGYPDSRGLGAEYDLEGDSSHRPSEQQHLSQGHFSL